MPNIEHRPAPFGNGFPGEPAMETPRHYAPPVEDIVLRRPGEEDGKYVAVVNGQGVPLHGATGNLIITKREIEEAPATAPKPSPQMQDNLMETRRRSETGSRSFNSIARAAGVAATSSMRPGAGITEQGQQGLSSGSGLDEQAPSDFFRTMAEVSTERENEPDQLEVGFRAPVHTKQDIWGPARSDPDIQVAPEMAEEEQPEPPQPAAARGPIRADIEPDDEGYDLGITQNITEFDPGTATRGRVRGTERSWRPKRVHE